MCRDFHRNPSFVRATFAIFHFELDALEVRVAVTRQTTYRTQCTMTMFILKYGNIYRALR